MRWGRRSRENEQPAAPEQAAPEQAAPEVPEGRILATATAHKADEPVEVTISLRAEEEEKIRTEALGSYFQTLLDRDPDIDMLAWVEKHPKRTQQEQEKRYEPLLASHIYERTRTMLTEQGFDAAEVERVAQEVVVTAGLRLPDEAITYQRHPIPEHVRHEVWKRDNGRCVDCGSRENLEYDHIVPVSRGGANTARNIELRCESCNRRKSNKV